MTEKRKSSDLAFLLSFLVAGLGLVYLKMWKKALINILAAFVVGYILSFFISGVILIMLIPISSGAWAYLEAAELNKKSAKQESEDAENPPGNEAEAQGTATELQRW